MPTLDLRHSRWIPVREQDGTITEVGLRDLFLRAHELLEIRDPLPIVEFGLYRLLVALVMDIYGFRDLRDLEELLAAGQFDMKRVDTYFADNNDRFDLFHEQYPFLQFPDITEKAKKDRLPLAKLLPAIPSGQNANHFYHALEDDFKICPEAAARLLVALSPFSIAVGRGYKKGLCGDPPWFVLIQGRNLFQTLCFNSCVLKMPQERGGDPAWKQHVASGDKLTMLAGLTWQPRRILLEAGEAGTCILTGHHCNALITSMRYEQGAFTEFDWWDPNVPYRIFAEGKKAVRPEGGRPIWRDIGVFALLHDEIRGSENNKIHFVRPEVVSQYAILHQNNISAGWMPNQLQLVIYGLEVVKSADVDSWQRESLEALPVPLVLYQVFGTTAQQEMDRAEKVDTGLKKALKCAYPRDGKGNKKAFDSRIDYALRRFWNALRPAYMELLHSLAAADPMQIDEAKKPLLERWKQQIRTVGWQTLDEAIQDLEANQFLQTEVVVRERFKRTLFFASRDPGDISIKASNARKGAKA